MPIEVISNNAVDTTLTADITSGATTMTLTSVVGWPTTGQWRALLRDGAKAEIVLCTPNSGATYNIQRAMEPVVGQDNTLYSTAQAWTAAGTTVHHIITGGSIDTKLAKTGGTMTGNLLMAPGASVRDSFGWQARNEQQMRLALGWGNGGQPSTVPRSRGFTAFDFSYLDLVPLNANAKQFQMATFDGRRVMMLPFGTFYAPLGTIASYDISKPFADGASWEFADLPTITGDTQAQGFLGGVSDPQGYLYFCPCIVPGGTGVTLGPNKAFRFNTGGELSVASNYEVFDFSTITGPGGPPTQYYSWQSMVCDGRYIYYVPCTKQNTGVITNVTNVVNPTVTIQSAHGLVAGDTVIIANVGGAIGVNGSWTVTTVPTSTTYTITTGAPGIYSGGGTSSCITPHGQCMRFDTQGAIGGFSSAFTNPANWSTFDLATINAQCVAFLGGIYDGRYIYFIPFAKSTGTPDNGMLLRFDTTDLRGFRDPGSYTTVDLEAMLSPAGSFLSVKQASRSVGFCGGIMVGPYLILTPFGGGAGLVGTTTAQRSLAVLYDTRLPIGDYRAYRTFDLRTIERKKYSVTAVTGTTNPTLTIGTHSLSAGQYVNISAVGGIAGINKTLYIQSTAPTTITVTATVTGTYTTGGSVTSGADETMGYQFGGFDGQYVHFTPSYNSARTASDCVCPPWVRWDVRLPFDEASSWSFVNTPLLGLFAIPAACTGLTFDGRFLYHAPYTGNTATYAPVIRVDTGSPNLAGMVDPLPDLYRLPTSLGGKYPPIVDDFIGGGSASLAIGNLGWFLQGGNITTAVAATDDHDGIIRFTSSATLGAANGIALVSGSSAGNGSVFVNGNNAKPFDLTFIVQIKAPSAAPTYRIGLTKDISTAQPTDGIYLECLNTDTSWFIVIRAASAQSRHNTGIAVSNNTWYTLRLKYDPPYMKYSINGQALQAYGFVIQSAANWFNTVAPPTMPTLALSPFVSLIPSSNVLQTIDIDYFELLRNAAVR